MKNRLTIYIFVLIGILVIEALIFQSVKISKTTQFKKKHDSAMRIMRFNHEKEKKRLNDEYDKNRYLASGKTVYERIFNIQDQSIIDMINGLAHESFPEGWQCETKVEEFTNFILLVQSDNRDDNYKVNEIAKYLIPVVTHAKPYLENIAVFDKKHKCVMFFDTASVNELIELKKLTKHNIDNILNNGQDFTRYNSVKIEYEDINGHMFVPAIVGGSCEVMMMLDTGASTTVISSEVAGKTSHEKEDLNKVEQRTFSTAAGMMSCPIVSRKVSVGSIDVFQPVAVNFKDEMSLLGVDFFSDYHYRIDSEAKCIYVWSK
ncbi:MAG: retropepsin-like aspartic protease [Candidatus Omnitrophota bacterium]